jgi:DNA-directed RNA polymerase specialized sigma24 family protein
MNTPTALSDTELLRQMRAGTASAFEALYLRHQGPLAADMVQEMFMGLLTDSLSFDPLRGLLQNFLFGVARNLVMKHEHPRRRCAHPRSGDNVYRLSSIKREEPAASLFSVPSDYTVKDVMANMARMIEKKAP